VNGKVRVVGREESTRRHDHASAAETRMQAANPRGPYEGGAAGNGAGPRDRTSRVSPAAAGDAGGAEPRATTQRAVLEAQGGGWAGGSRAAVGPGSRAGRSWGGKQPSGARPKGACSKSRIREWTVQRFSA
jgi:hypothetical protein